MVRLMRRQEKRRGAKVNQVKLTLKVLSPENPIGSSRRRPCVCRPQDVTRFGERAFLSRDLRPDRASKHEHAVTREIHRAARRDGGHWASSLTSKRSGGARWKSEALIVASSPGNAGGAKEGRKGMASSVDMTPILSGIDHDK